jgi:cytochrome c-type biogenesis protein
VIDAPLAYAFTVGMVATVNPCGFPLLPAYLSFFVGADQEGADAPGRGARVVHAARASLAVSLGFLAVFVALGVPINAGLTWIYRGMPWLAIAIGVTLAVLGVRTLRGRPLRLALPRLDRGGQRRTMGSMTLFGVSYAIASLSCTLPLFLAVVFGTSTRANPASGVAAGAVYALGMGTVLTALSVSIALARETLLQRLRRGLRHVDRVVGVVLVAVGAYLVVYGWWAARLGGDPAAVGTNPIRPIEDLSFRVTRWLGEGGVTLGVLLGVVVAGVLVWALVQRTVRTSGAEGRRTRT